MAANTDDLQRTQLGHRAGCVRNAQEDERAARRREPAAPRWAPGPAAVAFVHRFHMILVVLSAGGGLIAVGIDLDRDVTPSYMLARGFHRARRRHCLGMRP